MRTDAAFCNNTEVRSIMRNRRAHEECAAGLNGCEVVIGTSCGGRKHVGRGRGSNWLLRRRQGKRRNLIVVMSMWVVGLLAMSLVANLWFAARLYLNN